MKVGFFGKLPGYGDFIQRNVNAKVVDYFDNWILQAIDKSKNELSDNWQHLFFSSPIWRFHIPSGIVSNESFSGLLMPSVDSAGRCYPFLVICQFDQNCDIFKLASAIDTSHAKCEEFILDLLEKRRPDLDEISHTLYRFYKKLEKEYLPAIPCDGNDSVHEMFRYTPDNNNDFSQVNETFLSYLVSKQTEGISIWKRTKSQNLQPQYRYFKGMPPAFSYSDFLSA